MSFKPTLQLLLAAGVVGTAAIQSPAVVQTSSEVWVASSALVHGNGGSSSKVSFFSKRMVTPIETAGTIGTLVDTSLTDTNSTWTDGQFGTRGVPAYVEFDNGWMADIADCSAATHSLTLAGGLGTNVSIGSAYRIHKHVTIASLFGTNNEAGLLSGFNPSVADNILLEFPQSQQIVTVFYYNDGTFQGWLQGDYSSAANVIIYPEQGVIVRRRTTSDRDVYMLGPVKTGPTVVTIDQGNNLVGTLKSATPMALTQLNLYTGDPTTGIASGWNPSVSDNLLVFQPDGSLFTFFYYKDNTFEGWLDGAYNQAGSSQILPGSAFFIRRRAPNGAFNWTIPAE